MTKTDPTGTTATSPSAPRHESAAGAPRSAPVAVVIVHWRNVADTAACLGSLAAVDYAALEVVLVNNGSPDFDAVAFEAAFPGLVIVTAPRNLGFSGGNNLGIARALADGAEYVLLLNNDTVVNPNLVSDLLPAFTEPRVGIVGPIITYDDRPDLVWSAGGVYSRLLGYTPNPQMDRPVAQVEALGDRNVGYINGCALMASRAVFEAIGDLWEDYFLYFEEADFCLRAARAGYRCRVVGRPLVRHKVSASGGVAGSNAFTPAKAYYFGRNPFLMLRRNARGLWACSGYLSQFLVVFPFQLWQAIRSGQPGVMRHYLQGMWHGIIGRAGVRR